MTTDPGDLVLDPTCGSGTTAYVAEHWGRRWMTVDTSRIALNIAKTRLMTAVFPYFHLYSDVQVEVTEKGGKIIKKVVSRQGSVVSEQTGGQPLTTNHSDVSQGFVYEEVPHITLKSLANDEPPATEILYDRPLEDKSRLRVAGPFTVETLQSDEILPPETLAGEHRSDPNSPFRGPGGAGDGGGNFEERIFEHLKVAGIMNGAKNERAIFTRVERLSDAHLHAEGFYQSANGERKAYLHIGPQFGTVSKEAVNKSLRECRSRGDADWLIILGFSFESDISNQSVTTTVGSFEVTKVRMHDDLLQEGLTKKDKKAASFVTIGEPDISVVSGRWVVDSFGRKLCTYEQYQELSGLVGLAEIHGLGSGDLLDDAAISKGGTVRTEQSDAPGGGVHSLEHRRRAIEELNRRIQAISGHRTGVAVGTGNTDRNIEAAGLSTRGAAAGEMLGNRKDAQRLAPFTQLTAAQLPLQLTSEHWTQVTIEGLDIYDPIRDEIRSRSLHDIAYWMVDDDYDGVNFIVRQVFFCGGDKDEFRKWQKGISDVSARLAKAHAQRMLRLEMDDEPWERLYGFKSHPIPKTPGRKIAVRVVSQFGEESMKVLGA